MSNSETRQALQAFMLEQFPAARGQSFRDDTSLLEQGIVDSMGVLEIVTFLEQRFGLQLNDEDLVSESFDSIDAIAGLVEQKLQFQETCKP